MSEFERDRNESGQFSGEAYPDDVFVDVVSELELPTTGDVARSVGCSRSTAWYRLRSLEDDGCVSSQSVGTATVWTVVG